MAYEISRRFDQFLFLGRISAKLTGITVGSFALLVCLSSLNDTDESLIQYFRIKHCTKPIKNIVFLKTHFTGSDVITNVFNRFADLRNLRVALPADGLSTFHWPSRFQWKFLDMMTMGGLLPNILCNHARFNADVMDAIMDRQTAFVTIVRNPSTLFESTFRNLDFAAVLGMEGLADPFSSFLDSPGVHIRRAVREKRFRVAMNFLRLVYTYDASTSISHVWIGTTQAQLVQARKRNARLCLCLRRPGSHVACAYACACVVPVNQPLSLTILLFDQAWLRAMAPPTRSLELTQTKPLPKPWT